MQYTENYQYRKPVIGIDVADVKDINFNSDKTDTLIHNTQISLAPAYDLTKTYDTGDVVMYETLMYKCKEDNVTGAWDASKWERTTAGEEGAGGGGGSSVVPNPQGEPTDTLETIEIDGTIFDIAGSGGGSSGSGYLSRKIWDYIEDNNNTIPYGTYTVSLNDNINNYDMLVIENVSASGDLTDPNWASTNLWYIDVNALNNNWNNNYVTYTSWSTRATKFHIANTTFEALNNNGSDTNGLVRVYGLKWTGGGSGGGYSETSLYTYTGSTRQTTLSLSDDYTDYDAIEFTFGWNLGGTDFETINVISSSKIVSNVFVNVGGEGKYNYVSRGSADNEIILATATGSWDGSSIIREVRGINY